MKPMSVTTKIMALISSGMIFIITVLFISFFVFQSTFIKENEEQRIRSMVDVVKPMLTAAILFDDEEAILDAVIALAETTSVSEVVMESRDDRVFHRFGKHSGMERKPADQGVAYGFPIRADGEELGVLTVYRTNGYMDTQIAIFSKTLFSMFFFIIVLSIIFSYAIQHIISSPLKRFTSVIKSIYESGLYDQRAEVSTRDEVGELTTYFNFMMEEISKKDQWLEEEVATRTRELKQTNRQLYELAYTDPLTKIANRSRFLRELEYYTLHAGEQNFALMFIDLDKFKMINDSMGHDAGDLLLQEAAKRIGSAMDKDDIIARLGGDEFVIIHFGSRNRKQLQLRCEGLRQQFLVPFTLFEKEIFVSVSVGVAQYPADGKRSDQLIRNADEAMYQAKAKGRNRVGYYEPCMGQAAAERVNLTQDLRIALTKNEFVVYYQPIVDLKSGKWVKVEALLRWHHPLRGVISPGEFIRHAEENGMVSELGRWVFMQAAHFAKQLFQSTGEWIPISVNISPRQFNDKVEDYADYIRRFRRLRIPNGVMIIEITEGLLMDVSDNTSRILKDLRRLGIHLAIDDFGTGYSSLSYLRRFDIDLLKIDKSFVENLSSSKDDRAICEAVITMSHSLGISVVAEGIENNQQSKLLRLMGCDYGQGYHYA
uniref:bifunctional diguanylate cyclase/phosphodiesterase n=1 Tax=Thaumasiovibrio occultus TaxID=1891184 RepID=UPI000B36113F